MFYTQFAVCSPRFILTGFRLLTSPLTEILFSASNVQVSAPFAIFSLRIFSSATQITGNTVDMYRRLPGQILKKGNECYLLIKDDAAIVVKSG